MWPASYELTPVLTPYDEVAEVDPEGEGGGEEGELENRRHVDLCG